MRRIVFAFAVLLFISWSNVGYSEEVIDDTVAIVNNEPITAVDLYKSMQFYGTSNLKEAINRAIEDKLVTQMAKKLNVTIDSDEYKRLKDRFITKKRLKMLNRAGLKRKDMEAFIKLQMLKKKIVTYVASDNMMVTDSQIKKYYLENKERFKSGESFHLYEIAFNYDDSNENAQKLKASRWLKNIQNGKFKFIAAAKMLGYNRFDMGWIGASEMYPSFYNIVKQLKIGDLYGLIKTKTQFLIIKLVGRKGSHIKPLAEVKKSIRAIILNRNIGEAFMRWIASLKQNSSIFIYER